FAIAVRRGHGPAVVPDERDARRLPRGLGVKTDRRLGVAALPLDIRTVKIAVGRIRMMPVDFLQQLQSAAEFLIFERLSHRSEMLRRGEETAPRADESGLAVHACLDGLEK